ncbi:carboxymuconolactone decarboxylase family protein [Shewanella eurypsychrophilus]|uniref:Carboxymuconolactone decarboxylase family protein n=1 Tax=Shewanella eurypsychrophilus TaxID=2593656 RepID=A0ABX6V901_9GAMM|nr:MULTISPECIES: carboxymuconolactone decarboxylase family protein [Shewanella]QFU23783.1 carboxymuconolactone decarboxylase family protein [Shewanella sp. YLB-09]QPG59006.1 carboxymuconolactone decarboxylase family protein [Shewanella eurypsychrophilus]
MTQRIDIAQTQPAALTAMMSVENYLAETSLSSALKELIKIRASMINQCAYCIQMHTEVALKAGISQNKLFAISAWKESPLFDDIERAVLALTDELTLVSQAGLSDETYQQCLSLLGEEQVSQAIMQVIMINTWNRFAVGTKMTHQ